MIRGMLCRLCNSWIGVYEANLRKGQNYGRGKYKRWLQEHLETIVAYLKQDKGVYYPGRSRERKSIPGVVLRTSNLPGKFVYKIKSR
jgi:hypothetical protein